MKKKAVRIRDLVDSGAGRSVISKKLSEETRSFMPLSESYELRTADKEGKLRITGQCLVEVVFQGVKMPSRVLFEVAENLGEDFLVGQRLIYCERFQSFWINVEEFSSLITCQPKIEPRL